MWRPEGAVGQQPLLMLARAGSTGVPAGRARSARSRGGEPVRASSDTDSGVEVARDIHFLKGYTVFKVEQIDGLPEQYTAPASPLSATLRATTPPSRMRRRIGPHTNRAWPATSAPSVSVPKATRLKNSWPNSAPRSSVPILI
jgi:hypothetical protein